MAKNQNDLKIKVVLTEELLKKEPELSKVYDQKKGEIIYSVPNTITTEFKDEVKSMIENVKSNEVAVFNPLLFTLVQIHEFRDWKPEEGATEKETEERFQQANKVVRSFNSSLKKVKAEMKRPYIDVNKKIETVFKMLEEEVKITDSSLAENFKEHLAAKEEKKRLAEEKKKAAELARIQELQNQNDEILQKSKNQEIDNLYLQVLTEINSMVANDTSEIMKANEESLEDIHKIISSRKFENTKTTVPNFSILPDEKVHVLETKFNEQLKLSIKVVNDRIEYYRLQKENLEKANQQAILEAKNEVLATQNESLKSASDDLPFVVDDKKSDYTLITDLERIEIMSEKLNSFYKQSKDLQKEILEIPFENDFLKDVQSKVGQGSFDQIVEWLEKVDTWVMKKSNEFSNWNTKNNN